MNKSLAQMWALVKECSEPGWDGEGAEISLPEFAPEPDGSICLEWIQSRNCLFSLSVGANGRLAYAWMDGADKGHAVARFDGETIPPGVLEGIKRVAREGC